MFLDSSGHSYFLQIINLEVELTPFESIKSVQIKGEMPYSQFESTMNYLGFRVRVTYVGWTLVDLI